MTDVTPSGDNSPKPTFGFIPQRNAEALPPPKAEIIAPSPKRVEDDLKPPKVRVRPIKRIGHCLTGVVIVLAQTRTFFRYFRTITKQTFREAFEIAEGFRPASVQGLKSQSDAFWERLQIGFDLISGRHSDDPRAPARRYSPIRRAVNLLVFYLLIGAFIYYGGLLVLGSLLWQGFLFFGGLLLSGGLLLFQAAFDWVSWPFMEYPVAATVVSIVGVITILLIFGDE